MTARLRAEVGSKAPSRRGVVHEPTSGPIHTLDPLRSPGGWVPRVPEVDALADDLVVLELHDPYGPHWLAVVSDRVLVHPQVLPPDRAMQLELLTGWIGGSERDDVGLAPDALAALRPFEHGVVGVDLRGAGDVVARAPAGCADAGRGEVVLDHLPRAGLVHC